MEQRKENIVMFPFMAKGHIIPFLALALKLEEKGYNIIFVNTPLNLTNLRSFLPPNSAIRLLEIPFNSSEHGLPPNSENTDNIPYNLIFHLLQASTTLKPHFTKLLSDLIRGGAPPLCVISDIFFGWSADVAHEFGLFHVIFSGAGGFGLACYYSVWLNLPHRKTNSVEFKLADFPEAGRVHVTQLSASVLWADGTDPGSIFQHTNLPLWVKSNGILFNTVEELDNIGLTYFRRKLGIPIWPIGPTLLSVENRARSDKKAGITPELCLKWLDTKPPNSVLYISFGSQNTISATQMMQLAKALEASKTQFIWIVRPPLGFDVNADFKAEEWLPEGFIERIEEQRRGLIVAKWAPQVEILSHESVAGFLSHCGWNSVLESLSCGVPMIAWPMAAEQFYNVKFLEEMVGVCVEVARGTNFEVRCEDLMEKIEIVMGKNDRGKKMRRKACEVKEMIKDANSRDEEGFKGSSVKGMEDFLNAALLMKEKTLGTQ